jgi:hypothetical protein
MSFLFPGFLLGLAAIAIPILLHLRRQPPTNTVTFSSLMFLEKTQVHPRSRRKLEDWLLLLLRCFALALLAVMFMRPFFRSQILGEKANNSATVILLDRSASMQGAAWKAASKMLEEVIAGLHEEDAASVIAYDHSTRTIFAFDAWRAAPAGQRRAALRQQVQKVASGWGSTDLGKALVSAAESLNDQQASSKQIILISDMQEGAAMGALDGFTWPEDVQVSVARVDQPSQDNLTLSTSAAVEESGEPQAKSKPDQALRVRVSNSAASHVEKFSLHWRGDDKQKTEGSVPAGISRIVTAPPRVNPDADAVLELTGDGLDFDNRLFVARTQPRKVTILCLGKGLSRTDTSSPLFYLDRALTPNAIVEPTLLEKEPDQVTPGDFAKADFVIVCDDLNAAASTVMRDWLQAGHQTIFVTSERTKNEALVALTGLALTVAEAPASNYAMLSDLNFEHPILAPFAEAGVRDFTKVRFWKHRQLKGAATDLARLRVFARFDDGNIAMAEAEVGKGKMIIMTSGWHPSDSQLSVSSKFVPLLYAMLDRAGLASPESHSYVVGEPIPINEWSAKAAVKVKLPDGRSVDWNGDTQGPFTETSQVGIYVFGEGAAARSIAVNLAPTEGRIAPMGEQRLHELGVRLADAKAGTISKEQSAMEALQLADNEREQKQRIWKWLALAALVVLLAETWLAGRRDVKPLAMTTS